MQDSSLANRLELWGFEDGAMVFKDFSLGCGFEIPSIDISSESDEAINVLKHQIRQFLNGLPSKLSIQFIQAISGGSDKVITAHGDLAKNSLTDFQNEILKSRMASSGR